MKLHRDIAAITAFSAAQGGIFSTADLETLLGDAHRSALSRRIDRLVEAGILERALRGWYVASDHDPRVLSQRLAPESYLSLETALCDHGVIGIRPERRVTAVKVGKSRRYDAARTTIEHLGLRQKLFASATWTVRGVVRFASPERALIDALYFYQHGRPLPFDPYGDVNRERLDSTLLAHELEPFENPKFARFVEGVMT